MAFSVFLWSAEGVDALEPTLRRVPYGPDPMQFVNVWLAKSDKPTPVLVTIHGGGWTGGEVEEILKDRALFDRGVSVVAVEYRRAPDHPLPAPVMDAARAVQFVRSKAAEWNLDKSRLAVAGGSAGGCSALWIACHDDLADPSAADPVSRESSRPSCVWASNAQTSIDPPVIKQWIGEKVLQHRMIANAVGAASIQQALADYDKHRALYQKFSPINHLDASDPPIYLTYGHASTLPPDNVGHAIHHPEFGIQMKKVASQVGAQVTISTPEARLGSPRDFLAKYLLMPSEDKGE